VPILIVTAAISRVLCINYGLYPRVYPENRASICNP
jgi:hypothetical protein